MAVTVSGKNYTQISGCESTSDGGVWTTLDTQDSVNFKQGSYSLCGTMKSSGINTASFTPTSSVDMSGTKHLRMWFLDSAAGLLDTKANGGIQLGITDGSNTGYWNLGGKDTYNGGWLNLVVDLSSSVDVGIKPTNMNAITIIYLRITQTAIGKNFDNVWGDNLCLADGLIAYGDDAGGYFDFEDIFNADDSTLGIGIVRKIGGVYYLTGSIEIGDSGGTNGCKFQAKSQVVIFEDRPVNTSLYGINVVDNGTGTTEFKLGDKVGTAGIQGCVIRVASVTQTPKFYIDGSTDTDVDNFKLYGSTFYGSNDNISFPLTAANVEVLSCNFESCGQIDSKSASVRSCFFIGTTNIDSALLWNENIDIQKCSFVANTTGAAIEHPGSTGSPYDYYDLLFSGNTYDGLNTSGVNITVNNNGTSNASTDEGANTITYLSSATLSLTVKDESGSPIGNAYAYIDDNNVTPFIMNTTTNAVTGIATTGWTGGSVSDATWRVRKYGYKPFKAVSDVPASGTKDIPVTLIVDPQQT